MDGQRAGMDVGPVYHQGNRAGCRSQGCLYLAGLALASFSIWFFGRVGCGLDVVHLATVAEWLTGEVYPSVRDLHFRVVWISWGISVLVGALLAGLWAAVFSLDHQQG